MLAAAGDRAALHRGKVLRLVDHHVPEARGPVEQPVGLVDEHGAQIEQRDIFDEDVEFALPVALRRIKSDRGQDPGPRIRLGKPTITADLYGAVPVTVSARRARP